MALQDSLETFWEINGASIETLAVYGGGIMGYALVVNFFYQIISRRIMFGGESVDGRQVVGGPLYGFAYLLLFPLISFAFFMLLAASLVFLGSADQSLKVTFTLAMSIVLAVRVSAYFSEATSHDVAKMLPLGMLGVVLVNAEFADASESLKRMAGIGDEIGLISLYFGVVVVTEYVLRSVYMLALLFKKPKTPPKPVRPPRPTGAHGAEPRKK